MKNFLSSKILTTIISVALFLVGGYVIYDGFHGEPSHTPDISAPEYAAVNQKSVGPTKIILKNTKQTIEEKNMEKNMVLIPAINVYAHISNNDNAGKIINHELMLPPSDKVTQWDGSRITDPRGNIIIAGHVSWNGDPGALYNLAKVPLGSLIYVSDSSNNHKTFQLESKVSYKKTALPKSIWDTNKKKELIVITCGGKLHRISGAWHFDSNIVTNWKLIK